MGVLTGKVCAITGAGGKIGRALVERFLAAGATVLALDVRDSSLEGVDNVVCDQGKAGDVDALEEYVRERCVSDKGQINNGAVGGERGLFHEKTDEDYEMLTNVNVLGPVRLMRAALRLHLVKGTDSPSPLSIINITSIAASRPVPLGSLYSASKASLLSYTKSVALEYADKDVRCNALSPGYMLVPNVQGFAQSEIDVLHATVPMKRGGAPREVADLAVWLAGDEASYVTGAEFKGEWD